LESEIDKLKRKYQSGIGCDFIGTAIVIFQKQEIAEKMIDAFQLSSL